MVAALLYKVFSEPSGNEKSAFLFLLSVKYLNVHEMIFLSHQSNVLGWKWPLNYFKMLLVMYFGGKKEKKKKVDLSLFTQNGQKMSK